MNKILYIDACPRRQSRTRRLADALINCLDGETEHLILSDEELPNIDDDAVNARTLDSRNNDFSSDIYRYAKQFADADIIVIAAPFWDMSFPACLKKYVEAITVSGITFYYSEEGIPVGLCKAQKLYYVSTAGGPTFGNQFGYGYIKMMAEGMYGIKETECVAVENLDIIGNDPEALVNEAILKVRREHEAE